jgi:hypothetical protein
MVNMMEKKMKNMPLPVQPDRYDIERRRLLEMDIEEIVPHIWGDLIEYRSPREYRVRLPLFSSHVDLSMPEGTLECPDPRLIPYLMRVLILHYCCHHSEAYPSGKWVPYAELPDGLFYAATLSQNFQAVADRFGTSRESLNQFESICTHLGGTRYTAADSSFVLPVLPKTPLLLILHRGDEELPPQGRALLDERTTQFLDIDFAKLLIVATLGVVNSLGKSAALTYTPPQVD